MSSVHSVASSSVLRTTTTHISLCPAQDRHIPLLYFITIVFYNGCSANSVTSAAIETPQNANHYSLTQGQVNILQAFSVQLIVIFMQQVYSVIPVYCKGHLQ